MKWLLVAGVDEAGRGPVIGPMIVSGVLVEESSIDVLTQIGVTDSKRLTPPQRVKMLKWIFAVAKNVVFLEVPPSEIDEAICSGMGLNELEARKMAEVVDKLQPDVAYLDAVDPHPGKFGERVKRYLACNARLIAEHNADEKYVVVGAASIIAKVIRDLKIDELKVYGEVGSGYPQDPRTITFLRCWVREKGCLPSFARQTWKTSKRILDEFFQKKLV
ncbi:MAG: ribonuclease HII [Candidatus Freyarchaeota archaeon]|nr:ribonuclease HII [Candidatus Jordarchaeia archaeon]